jgi:hypothetical protein
MTGKMKYLPQIQNIFDGSNGFFFNYLKKDLFIENYQRLIGIQSIRLYLQMSKLLMVEVGDQEH